MKSRTTAKVLAVLLAVAFVGAACGGDDDDTAGTDDGGGGTEESIDYTSIGLWDDGACDTSKPKLSIGLMTVFESPVLSLKDQATALEASAEAFNKRGGANGSCIEVHVCDDGANPDKAVGCVREIDQAGVVATVNDQGTVSQGEVSDAMAAAKIPRVASNVTNATGTIPTPIRSTHPERASPSSCPRRSSIGRSTRSRSSGSTWRRPRP